MNQESRGARTLSSPMIAAITAGVVLVLVIAILVGVRIGQSVLTSASSGAAATTSTAAPSVAATSTPTEESSPTETPEPTRSNAAPTESVAPHFERVTPTPVPEQSFAEVQPLPPAPPAVEQADVVPTVPSGPTPEPTCPADKGVTLTIVKAERDPVVSSDVLDAFRLTFVLENKFSVPVSIEVGDLLTATAVRANGTEMGNGYVSLPETYELQPGRTSFVSEGSDEVMAFRRSGDQIAAFKLGGSARLLTRTWDIDNAMSCEYKGMAFGKPLQGSWELT